MSKIKDILQNLNPEFIELENDINQKINFINNSLDKISSDLFSENQTMLITYPDQFQSSEKSSLQCLNSFLENDLAGSISIAHILPFYPWTSDDGFSPINYHEVCQDYGDWADIKDMKTDKMFDCVFNHLSSKNDHFQKALAGDKSAQAMFHFYDKKTYQTEEFQENIKKVVRPRTSDLFTEYKVNNESKYVWTTFSADQVDTNLESSAMLKYILDCFFKYIENGARFFRIDAVPFLWKELGTNCSHHEKTHLIVKLFRAVVDEIHLPLFIVTESNVPHDENVTYWGDGSDEAHIIYNFSLAPLVAHAILFENSETINKWSSDVFDIHKNNTFLNFTATHDGLGMRGLEGIVSDEEIQKICTIAESHGGVIGKKRSRDGTIRPYELNITWASLMQDNTLSESEYRDKIVNSHAIVMFFPGIGAHYAHNFFGTQNWQEGFKESGIARRLNRLKINYPIDYTDFSLSIKSKLVELIKFKCSHKAFNPKAGFEIIDFDKRVIAFKRFMDDEVKKVYFNITKEKIFKDEIELNPYELKII